VHRQLQNGFIISLHDRRRNAQGSKQEFISTCLSIYLSIYLSVCLSVCLSIFGCSITSHTVQRREKKQWSVFMNPFPYLTIVFPPFHSSLPLFSTFPFVAKWPLTSSLGVWGSAVNSPSEVRGRAKLQMHIRYI